MPTACDEPVGVDAFADASGQRLRALADLLAESPASQLRRLTPKGLDIDSVIDPGAGRDGRG